jgi:hypothetical protein
VPDTLTAPARTAPRLRLSSRALKVTTVVDAAALTRVKIPDGLARIPIAIDVAGETYGAELNAKSLRRVIAVIAEHGPDGVAVLVQGKLAGDTIEEAGISAQVKARSE